VITRTSCTRRFKQYPNVCNIMCRPKLKHSEIKTTGQFVKQTTYGDTETSVHTIPVCCSNMM
jgi:hypothetical protein